jgi:hypothetical protein
MTQKDKTDRVEKLSAMKSMLFSVADKAALANGHNISTEASLLYYRNYAKTIKMAAIGLKIRKNNESISLRKE